MTSEWSRRPIILSDRRRSRPFSCAGFFSSLELELEELEADLLFAATITGATCFSSELLLELLEDFDLAFSATTTGAASCELDDELDELDLLLAATTTGCASSDELELELEDEDLLFTFSGCGCGSSSDRDELDEAGWATTGCATGSS